MYLLNEYNTHFDLLVQRKDVLCSVQSYQDKEQDNATEPVIDNTEEIELPGKETSSPLQFQPNVVSKGRPKNTRFGAPQFNKKSSESSETEKSRAVRGRKRKTVSSESNSVEPLVVEEGPQPVKRGRGRPKGSKNKPK